jgi:hypothetical protein
MQVSLCEECRVPEPFYEGQKWLDNGDIVQAANPGARLGFIECENLDPLFRNISMIIGVPIDHLVTNITARGTKLYMDSLIPKEIKDLVQSRVLPLDIFSDSISTYCEVVGFGKYEFIDYRYEKDEDDYSRLRILHPFSVPEAAGAYAGAVSAVVGGEHEISYLEVAPGTWEFTSHWTEYPEVLKEKIKLREYRRSGGDIELEHCRSCGSPKAFSEYHWYLEKGVIVNGYTGRRMTVLGFEMLDAVFDALENELGDTIPRVVVEAQRQFVKTGFYSIEQVASEGELRTQLALRGLGNLREIKMGTEGMSVRIDNVACHLMLTGIVQGLFEMALDVESDVDWEVSENGDLQVEVLPRTGLRAASNL